MHLSKLGSGIFGKDRFPVGFEVLASDGRYRSATYQQVQKEAGGPDGDGPRMKSAGER